MRHLIANKIIFLILATVFTVNIYSYAGFQVTVKLPSARDLAYRMVINQTVFNDYKGELLATGKADGTGSFTAELKVDKEGEGYLFVGNQFYKLWFGPKGSLSMSQEQGNLKFTGDYANENEVLYLTSYMQPSAVNGYFAFAKTQASSHAKMLDDLELKRTALLKAYQSKLSPLFFTYMEQEIPNFSRYKKSQFALAYNLKAEELPAGYHDFWEKLQILPDDTDSKSYFGSIGDYTEFKIKQRHAADQTDRATRIHEQFELIDSLLAQRPKTLARIKGELILFYIKYIDEREMINTLKTAYETAYPNSDYTKLIATNWSKKNQQYLTKPSFSLKNPQGENISIESLKGKIVYIDFWGSWCKACLMEMPSSKLLREKFKGKDIVFLYLDFYDTTALWLKAISTYQITGINLKAEPADELYFNEVFGIKTGFPRYVVLDKNGLLISTSAPSPSSKEIKGYLEKLLDN